MVTRFYILELYFCFPELFKNLQHDNMDFEDIVGKIIEEGGGSVHDILAGTVFY